MEGAQSSPVSRRTANYQPSLWDDKYVQSLPDRSPDASEVELWMKLKEEVRHLIDHKKQEDVIALLEFVDNLRQLGISYHFECEINNVLSSIASSLTSISNILENSLHGSSLLFRLQREYGIKIISEDFLVKRFKNENGSIKDDIIKDVKGMLSLYEASFLAIEGECELDEAMQFTTKHFKNYLKKMVSINPLLFEQISHALELPLHWRISRVHTKWFIDVYERQQNINAHLLTFAKLDFNMLQTIYMEEIKEMSRWWRNLGLISDEFHFARDRLMEAYFWSAGCTFEPQFGRCRKEIVKLGCIVTTIDDIYDVYGSLEELELFTNAVERWEIPETQQLPNYMKTALMALFSTVNEIACASLAQQGLDILPQLKRTWRDLCKGYLLEAIWYNTKYTPTLNEYIENAWITISAPLLQTFQYCLTQDCLTEEAVNSLEFYPKFTYYSSIITRLYNDLGTSTDEISRGDAPKSIQCYMNETNASESVARDHIKHLIKRYWILLNGEYNNLEFFKGHVLNLPRMSQCIYQNGDGHGKPDHDTKDKIISSIIKHIPL